MGMFRNWVRCCPTLDGDQYGGRLITLDSTDQLDHQQGHSKYWIWPKFQTPSQGASTYVFGAFSPDLKDQNGAYLANSAVVDIKEVYCWTRDAVDANRLWALSEKLTGQRFVFD